MSAMKTRRGDLLQLADEGAFDVIAHGCNCFCTMGAGIAKGVAARFPQALEADQQTPEGDRAKLGTCSFAEIETPHGKLTVVNAYTQFHYRGRGDKADYEAIRACMRWLAEHHGQSKIGLPKIGAGLAGGDWPRIERIIGEELVGCDVTVVEYQP